MEDLPADEYDSYAPAIADLVRRGADVPEIAAWLSTVETTRMGLPPRSPAALLDVAVAARAILVEPPLSRGLVSADDIHAGGSFRELEAFISAELRREEVAGSTDGIRDLRLLLDGPDRSILAGELWTIDQETHLFCLELVRGPDRTACRWTLWFDLAGEPGATLYVLDPDGIADERWSYRLTGTMTPATGPLPTPRPD